MVYGRYNYIVFMGIVMVNKPTYNWGPIPYSWGQKKVKGILKYFGYFMKTPNNLHGIATYRNP
jgi:hypothetical protein